MVQNNKGMGGIDPRIKLKSFYSVITNTTIKPKKKINVAYEPNRSRAGIPTDEPSLIPVTVNGIKIKRATSKIEMESEL